MSQELPPQIKANDPETKDKGFMAKLSKSAGAASKLVALQAERTKLNTLNLPAAYRALGKDCLQQRRHLDCAVELTSQLRSVLDEIKKLAEIAPGQSVPQSFTDKAKAAGKYAVDTARQKQLGMKRDSLIANIGKAIYENHADASGPGELVEPIASSIARIAQIDTEISQQSQAIKGSIVKPRLGWLIPSKRKIAIGFGVAFAAFVLLAMISQRITQGVRLQLTEGRQLWDEGKHDEAIARFKAVIGEHPNLIPSFDRPIIFKQVIEHDTAKGNIAAAKILIEKALTMNIPLEFTLPQAREILIAVEAEKQRIHQEAEEKERQVALGEAAKKEKQAELDDAATRERQKALDKEAAKDKQSALDKAASGNAKVAPSSPSVKSITADELRELSFSEINSHLGKPSEVVHSTSKPNLGLAVWRVADNDFIVVTFAEAIDGRSPTLVMTVHDHRSQAIVEEMKRSFQSIPLGQPKPEAKKVTYSVSKGFLKGDMTVELSPSAATEISLKEFKIDGNIMTFLLTKKLDKSGIDPWHYSVFDANGTKLEAGVVNFSGAIGKGDTVKSNVFIGYDNVKTAVRILIDTHK